MRSAPSAQDVAPTTGSFHVNRRPVAPEPLLEGVAYDYADAFEVQLGDPDSHPAEVWIRTALEQSPTAIRELIVFVHQHVLRFQLGPRQDADHILGWRIVSADPAALHIEASGPLLRAAIVARRTSPTSAAATSFLFFKRPVTGVMWLAVGPIHRRIVPYLLTRAAAALTADRTVAGTRG